MFGPGRGSEWSGREWTYRTGLGRRTRGPGHCGGVGRSGSGPSGGGCGRGQDGGDISRYVLPGLLGLPGDGGGSWGELPDGSPASATRSWVERGERRGNLVGFRVAQTIDAAALAAAEREAAAFAAARVAVTSATSEEGRGNDEGPQHRVTIGSSFAVGVYEVTVAEWDVERGGMGVCGACGHTNGALLGAERVGAAPVCEWKGRCFCAGIRYPEQARGVVF